MNKELSNKITHMSFFAIILVVLLHAYCSEEKFGIDNSMSFIIQEFLGRGIVKIAVPTFFFISGFLFFHNFSGTLSDIKVKFRRRVDSLLFPYMFWCGAWFILIFLLQLLPISQDYFSSPFYQMSLADNFWNAFFQPFNYPFWFLRELMIYILLTPLLYLILNRIPIVFLLFIFSISLVKFSMISIWDVALIKNFCFTFFVAGAIVGLRKISLVGILKWYQWLPLLLVWLSMISLRMIGVIHDNTGVLSIAIEQFEIILGVFVVWVGYDFIPRSFKEKKKGIYSYTFIIYAFHGVPIIMLNKFYFKLIERNPYWELISFIMMPLLVISMSVLVGKLLSKKKPLFYSRITGGR